MKDHYGILSINSVNLNNCQSLPKGFKERFLLRWDLSTWDTFIFGRDWKDFYEGEGELLRVITYANPFVVLIWFLSLWPTFRKPPSFSILLTIDLCSDVCLYTSYIPIWSKSSFRGLRSAFCVSVKGFFLIPKSWT